MTSPVHDQEKNIRELPIIFNGEMARAILDGRKTQTRRPVKHIPLLGDPLRWCAAAKAQEPGWVHIVGDYRRFAPYQIRNHLYVRETWGTPDADHPYAPDGRKPLPGDRLVYRANLADDYQWGSGKPSQGSFVWRPSIHMPKWVARIWIEVTGVRVERVQEISDDDAKAEGCKSSEWVENLDGSPCYSPMFRSLWVSAYGIDNPNAWERNPWVWVYEFTRIKKP